MPWTIFAVMVSWVAIGGLIAFQVYWIQPAQGASNAELQRITSQVAQVSTEFAEFRVESTEEALLRNRERMCSSSSAEARQLYQRRQSELVRRYYRATGQQFMLPPCAETH